MGVLVQGNEIVLSGTVGDDWWGDGFTAGDVISALAQVGRETDVIIRLNSGGGYATEGAAIHAALKNHKGVVTVIVEGIAASAASLIAMGAEVVSMALGSVMMIHDPSTITWGTAADHKKSIDMLESLATTYADTYADKTGATGAAMRALMKEETWLTPEEAVAQKFADRLEAANGNEVEPTAFAYALYAHAPEKIVALANARGWKASHGAPKAATSAAPRQTQEPPKMTAITPADASAAEATIRADERAKAAERHKAILTSEEAEGRAAMAARLAYETDLTAEAAIALMKTASKAAREAPPSFAERKEAAADGLGGPSGAPKAPARASWKKVTDKLNKSN